MTKFKINHLDHVAIRVSDMETSIKWYKKVIGLVEKRYKEWGDFPVFMLSGDTGIALFPADLQDEALNAQSKNIKIDHFAFNISYEDLEKAEQHYKTLRIPFYSEDHHYFHSIYTNDPDGHLVELTAVVPSRS